MPSKISCNLVFLFLHREGCSIYSEICLYSVYFIIIVTSSCSRSSSIHFATHESIYHKGQSIQFIMQMSSPKYATYCPNWDHLEYWPPRLCWCYCVTIRSARIFVSHFFAQWYWWNEKPRECAKLNYSTYLHFFFLLVSIVNDSHIPKVTQVARELAANRRDTSKNTTVYTKCSIKTWE